MLESQKKLIYESFWNDGKEALLKFVITQILSEYLIEHSYTVTQRTNNVDNFGNLEKIKKWLPY